MKVYLVSGKAKHGKDTTGKFIKEKYLEMGKKSCIMHLSNPIKEYCLKYFGWDGKEEDKPRELMQRLGSEIIRKQLGKQSFFVDRITEDIEILSHFFDCFIITDVRLPYEIEELKKRFPHTCSIHIYRRNFKNPNLSLSEQNHETEVALDDYQAFDYYVYNDTLEQLQKEIEEIVRKEEVKDEKND